MLRRAPWLYDGVYALFLQPHRRWQPPITPLSWLIARTLRPVIGEFDPTAVVSTIHIAGQGVGRLRDHEALSCPSVVVITEAVPHALWFAAGTDLFCGMFPEIARIARARTSSDTIAPGPVVSGPIAPGAGSPPVPSGDALVVAGAWGVGSIAEAAVELRAAPGVQPVVLCGRNGALRAELSAIPGVLALGWRDDVPQMLRDASVVIDNAGGSM